MDNSRKETPEQTQYSQESWYAKVVKSENAMQPTYGNFKEVNEVGGGVQGEHSNKQVGP